MRTVRNSFEHLDERIGRYFDDHYQQGNCYVDRIVGSILINGSEPLYLRRFDPVTKEITVLDKSVSIDRLLVILKGIAVRAQDWLDQHQQETSDDDA